MIPQINIPPFENVVFSTVQGTVLSSQKSSNTLVGGSQHSIHSVVVSSSNFWLLTENKEEKHFNFSRYDVPLREGHEVSIIYAGRQEIFVSNETTNMYTHVYYGEVPSLSDAIILSIVLGGIIGGIGGMLIAVSILGLLSLTPDNFGETLTFLYFFCFILIVSICFFYKKYISFVLYRNRINRIKAHVMTHLNWNS
jgi:hypothetical protein